MNECPDSVAASTIWRKCH